MASDEVTRPESAALAVDLRPQVSDRPATMLLAAAALLTTLGVLLALVAGPFSLLFDNLQELAAAGGGALALAVAARSRTSDERQLIGSLAMSLGGACLGMVAWDLAPLFGDWLMSAGDVVFVASAVLGAVVTAGAIFVGIRPDRLVGVAIDTFILLLTSIAVVAALWGTGVVHPGDETASIGAVILIGATAGCAFGLVARRIGPSAPSPWILLAGGIALGAAWLLWIGDPTAPSEVGLSDVLFSVALLVIAFAGVTWRTTPAEGHGFDRLDQALASFLPAGAILVSLALLLVARGEATTDLLVGATSAVIVASVVRGLYLYAREALAREALDAGTQQLQSAVRALEVEMAERRRLEAEREAMQVRMLENQRLESVGWLAGGVAHDFNNLLTAIQGYTDLLALRLGADHPAQPDLAAVRHASEQAASLTKQLLAFSRNQQLRPSVVDVGDVVLRAEPLLRRLLGERIELIVRPAPDLWPVLVDPSQLEAIVVNLAVNARDAMESGGRLVIETANETLDAAFASGHPEVSPGPYAMMAVSDTGVGMDAATLPRIFEPFFTTKGLAKGSGLGLSTVYGTIRQSGGHILVSSEVGAGTTFRIYLPRTEQPHEEIVPTAAQPTSARGRHETILVAEDEADLRRMIATALTRQGHEVLAVGSGEEALEAIDRGDADIALLLTDVVMPGMSGLELVEKARRRRQALPAVCMSGYTPVQLEAGSHVEDVTFLGKPFTLERLAQVIDEALST